MASLEDTFRMMKGEEPVNTDKLTEEDKTHLQMFPELRSYVKGKIKLPSRPKRQKRKV